MKNSENKTILDYETVDFNKEENCLVIIDQTLLPGKTEIIELKTAQEIWDAIYLLKVRGAPAIGVAAAFGIYQLSFEIWKNRKNVTCEEFEKQFLEQKEFLNAVYSVHPRSTSETAADCRRDCGRASDRRHLVQHPDRKAKRDGLLHNNRS